MPAISAALRGSLTLNPAATFRAFDEWAALQRIRGKSEHEILRRVMRFWISFAIAKIDAGDAGKIRTDLMKMRRNYHPPARGIKGAVADKYRGTLAAFIVQKLNWKGANTAKKKNGDPAFYGKVGQFINARVFSRNLHKAGFRPTLAALRAKPPAGARLPNYAKMPGSYNETVNDWAAELIAENFATAAKRPGNTAAPLGISGLAPNCLSDAEPDVARQLEKWLADDLAAAARAAGFTPTRTINLAA